MSLQTPSSAIALAGERPGKLPGGMISLDSFPGFTAFEESLICRERILRIIMSIV